MGGEKPLCSIRQLIFYDIISIALYVEPKCKIVNTFTIYIDYSLGVVCQLL